MSVIMEVDRIQEVRDDFYRRARNLMGDTVEHTRDVARSHARYRTTRMMALTQDFQNTRGWYLDYGVESTADYAFFNEYGTGIYHEGGGGRQDPWVYYDEYLGQFFTTEGMTPQPFMRPGYEAGRGFLFSQAKSYFRGLR